MEHVILVNERDEEIGTCEKLAAHREGGRLHRAFSILVFNARGEILLQRRAAGKYHFAGLWSNTCCGHPRPGEETVAAAQRRLAEEFGIDALPLREKASLLYNALDAASGLMEREYLHVLVGQFDGTPRPDAAEIGEWSWRERAVVLRELAAMPGQFTPWFRLVLEAAGCDERT